MFVLELYAGVGIEGVDGVKVGGEDFVGDADMALGVVWRVMQL